MDTVGIANRDEYISFHVASSLLNYHKIWKDEEMEKELKKLKEKLDHENLAITKQLVK